MPYTSGTIGIYNGMNIIALPSDTQGVTAPSSIEWDANEAVAANESPFTFQTQTYDWMASILTGTVSFPPMNRYSYDAWAAFILALRGQLNCFLMGDPKAALPKGLAKGTPVVAGGGQTGYTLATRGWVSNTMGILLPGDYIQVGYRLYRVTASVYTDNLGDAVIPVWPNIRDLPTDGTTVVTRNCRGLFRLASNSGNKFSVNPGAYGLSGFKIREAL